MGRVHLILSCLVIAAEAVLSAQQYRASLILDLYNEKLNFFDSFLSPSGVDGLLLSEESVSFDTVKTLRQASIPYTTLRGQIISWCTEVNSIIDGLDPRPNQPNFASSVREALNQMKGYFDSITTNGAPGQNAEEEYQAVITIAGGVRKLEVIKGRTPNNIDKQLSSLLEKSKFETNVTENIRLTGLDGKLSHAKNITAEALTAISSAANDGFDREKMIAKCRPILGQMSTLRTSPAQYAPLPQRIVPSPKDSLRIYPNSCGGTLGLHKRATCEAILSKSTLERLRKLYRTDASVSDFFNAIGQSGSSSKCNDRMKSFIKHSYMSWAYEIDEITSRQSLVILICLNSNLPVQVTRT
ncbi:hypothetical protein TSAR_002024 [Trichomalopsis sarcophagae]|uniref:Uncharacterized protein n=1 Tax=Trichomalopsis sarcophagae TaxID=543379 RepID=A0A232FMR3_9HYME|nr:hypothetical protein TSAR_002024 [Trichomalopsis sarcophagae]